jgi:hypothetical protein
MRKPSAVFAAVAVCALAAAPAASADHRSGHHDCESAGAGATFQHGRQWHSLETRNLSCRKGLALMKAFARRNASPSLGGVTERINGFRCAGDFDYHAEGVYGSVVCRKGIRRARWNGTYLGLGGIGAPG